MWINEIGSYSGEKVVLEPGSQFRLKYCFKKFSTCYEKQSCLSKNVNWSVSKIEVACLTFVSTMTSI